MHFSRTARQREQRTANLIKPVVRHPFPQIDAAVLSDPQQAVEPRAIRQQLELTAFQLRDECGVGGRSGSKVVQRPLAVLQIGREPIARVGRRHRLEIGELRPVREQRADRAIHPPVVGMSLEPQIGGLCRFVVAVIHELKDISRRPPSGRVALHTQLAPLGRQLVPHPLEQREQQARRHLLDRPKGRDEMLLRIDLGAAVTEVEGPHQLRFIEQLASRLIERCEQSPELLQTDFLLSPSEHDYLIVQAIKLEHFRRQIGVMSMSPVLQIGIGELARRRRIMGYKFANEGHGSIDVIGQQDQPRECDADHAAELRLNGRHPPSGRSVFQDMFDRHMCEPVAIGRLEPDGKRLERELSFEQPVVGIQISERPSRLRLKCSDARPLLHCLMLNFEMHGPSGRIDLASRRDRLLPDQPADQQRDIGPTAIIEQRLQLRFERLRRRGQHESLQFIESRRSRRLVRRPIPQHGQRLVPRPVLGSRRSIRRLDRSGSQIALGQTKGSSIGPKIGPGEHPSRHPLARHLRPAEPLSPFVEQSQQLRPRLRIANCQPQQTAQEIDLFVIQFDRRSIRERDDILRQDRGLRVRVDEIGANLGMNPPSGLGLKQLQESAHGDPVPRLHLPQQSIRFGQIGISLSRQSPKRLFGQPGEFDLRESLRVLVLPQR